MSVSKSRSKKPAKSKVSKSKAVGYQDFRPSVERDLVIKDENTHHKNSPKTSERKKESSTDPRLVPARAGGTGFEPDFIAVDPEGCKGGLKNIKPKFEPKFVPDFSSPENYLLSLLSFHNEDAYFPFGALWGLLKESGWAKTAVPPNVTSCPKHSNAYFPFWTTRKIPKSSDYVSATGSSLSSDILEGRDYFYEHKHIIEYLQLFGNKYDTSGLLDKLNVAQTSRRPRKSLNYSENDDAPQGPVITKVQRKDEKLAAWRSELMLDNFCFDENVDVFVGKRVRRFFRVGHADGTCVCVRLETEETPPMYGVVHDDKDFEVLELIDVQRGYNDFIKSNLHEPFDYKLYESEKDSEVLMTQLEAKHQKESEKNNLAHEKQLEKATETMQERHEGEMSSLREKYDKRKVQLEKAVNARDKLEMSHQNLRNELNDSRNETLQCTELINRLRNEVNFVKAEHQSEVFKVRQESCETVAKIRMDMEAFSRSRSVYSTEEAVDQKSSPALPQAVVSRPENVESLFGAWREFLIELRGSDRVAKEVALTRTTEANALLSRGSGEIDKYPIRITIEYFSKWNSKERLSAPLRVTFQHMEAIEGRVVRRNGFFDDPPLMDNSGDPSRRNRQRLVQDSAFDAGGLLRQWLGDFFTALRIFTLPISALPSWYMDGFEVTAFVSRGSRYLPPAVFVDAGKSVPLQLYDLRVSSSKDAAKDNQIAFITNLYTTVGKVISQVVREEGACLPESFASPLLIYYLLGGSKGLQNFREISYREIETAVIAFDIGYTGTLKFLNDSSSKKPEVERKRMLCEWIDETIYYPRSAFLELIKKGFDIVPIKNHLLYFSPGQFEKLFVGVESVTPSELKTSMVFDESFDAQAVAAVLSAIDEMSAEERRQFLVFASGMPFINPGTTVIEVKKSEYTEEEMVRWPVWPMPKSFTCFHRVMLPHTHGLVYETANILENLRRAFEHNNSDFSDQIMVHPPSMSVVSNTSNEVISGLFTTS